MTSTTATYAFPFPDESDPPDGATQMENLANALDAQLAVTDGNVATNATHDTILATLLGTAQVHYTHLTATIGNLTSLTFTALLDSSSNSCGHSFIAPPSGIVKVSWGANIVSGSSGNTVIVGTAVKTGATVGAGTIVSDVVDGECFGTKSTATVACARSRYVTGLTPGSTYNVRISWRNSGSTTSVGDVPWITTDPALA